MNVRLSEFHFNAKCPTKDLRNKQMKCSEAEAHCDRIVIELNRED
jgi:hypothetical protein